MSPLPPSPPEPPPPAARSFWSDALADIKEKGLNRKLRKLRGAPGPYVSLNGRKVLLLCSNNYLGLATDGRVKRVAEAAIEQFGCGATGSRLISGNTELYETLERDLAAFKGTERALVFASGYHANIGTIPALVEAGGAVFSDALNHASIIDGARLSRAEINIFRHRDLGDLENQLRSRRAARRKLIVTEAVFSMDGDLAPLRDLAFLAKKHGAMLMVDEAHATGLFGPTGAGLIESLGLHQEVDVQMGTFSKALGSLGGYVAGSRDLIEYLLNRSRSFIFTTGLPPAVLAASTEAIRITREEPQRRAALWENVRVLRKTLQDHGYSISSTEGHIIPVLLGDERRTMAASRYLLKQGVFVQGIRPPTVPSGTARLRIAPMATHTADDLMKAGRAFEQLQNLLQSSERRRALRQRAAQAVGNSVGHSA